ncbi:MAG: hypothetical protein GWN84_17990, partial [Gammaproteobacteria bacterium]|nr:hypothetical protein [Gammaproteobacteria bacterium]
AFIDEGAGWACARRVTAGGGVVEDVERRRFDLEYLFHSLIQGGAEEGGA